MVSNVSLPHVAEALVGLHERDHNKAKEFSSAEHSFPAPVDLPESSTDWINMIRQITTKEPAANYDQ